MVNMTPVEAYRRCSNENRRILDLEEIIATDSYYSCLYAQYIMRGKFERGEISISKDPEYSHHYAHYIIKDLFPLCHPIIFKSKWKERYIDFLKSINYDLSQIGEWLI